MTWLEITGFWNAFFHHPVSCAPLVLFRILIGLILVLNSLLLIPLFGDFYDIDGVWSLKAWKKHSGGRQLSLLSLLPSTNASFRCLWLVHFLACLAVLTGCMFRISSVIVFVTLVSIHHRNPFLLSSGDTLLRLFTFFLIFSAAGESVSIDAVIQGSKTAEFPQMDPWPLRLMQLQVCIVYLRTVFWKLRGKLWWNGTAAWYPLWVDSYLRNRPPRWMLQPVFIRVATWGTLVEEFLLGTAIWSVELRYPVLFGGILMHLVFELIMNLQFFGWIMICALLLFIFPADAEWLLARIVR